MTGNDKDDCHIVRHFMDQELDAQSRNSATVAAAFAAVKRRLNRICLLSWDQIAVDLETGAISRRAATPSPDETTKASTFSILESRSSSASD